MSNRLQAINADENYFDIFKLDQNNFTPEELDNSYYKLNHLYHPDKYIDRPSNEQVIAQENAELINKIYRTLKNDMQRYEYILEYNKVSPNIHPDDMDLLQEVMLWNERLEDENLNDLQKEFLAKKEYLTTELRNKIAKALYLEAKKDYIALKYLNRFLTKLHEVISNQ